MMYFSLVFIIIKYIDNKPFIQWDSYKLINYNNGKFMKTNYKLFNILSYFNETNL